MTRDQYSMAREELLNIAVVLASLRPMFSNPLALPAPRKLHEAEIAIDSCRRALDEAWKRNQPGVA